MGILLVITQLVSTLQMKTHFKIELCHIKVTMLKHTQLAHDIIMVILFHEVS